ncbi:hypothetical protein VP01_1202g2 [Puccinia sorghi]|uniref:Uncharacterized protein n=1 Tax=Puccinia sorghi TaxID=27349 RepID=A0A0L6VRY3_9BASI|nr:hypothetical protein VP01_1202g2 [Puccinia sorghi]
MNNCCWDERQRKEEARRWKSKKMQLQMSRRERRDWAPTYGLRKYLNIYLSIKILSCRFDMGETADCTWMSSAEGEYQGKRAIADNLGARVSDKKRWETMRCWRRKLLISSISLDGGRHRRNMKRKQQSIVQPTRDSSEGECCCTHLDTKEKNLIIDALDSPADYPDDQEVDLASLHGKIFVILIQKVENTTTAIDLQTTVWVPMARRLARFKGLFILSCSFGRASHDVADVDFGSSDQFPLIGSRRANSNQKILLINIIDPGGVVVLSPSADTGVAKYCVCKNAWTLSLFFSLSSTNIILFSFDIPWSYRVSTRLLFKMSCSHITMKVIGHLLLLVFYRFASHLSLLGPFFPFLVTPSLPIRLLVSSISDIIPFLDPYKHVSSCQSHPIPITSSTLQFSPRSHYAVVFHFHYNAKSTLHRYCDSIVTRTRHSLQDEEVIMELYKRRKELYREGYIITRRGSYIHWIGYSITRGGKLSCMQWTRYSRGDVGGAEVGDSRGKRGREEIVCV